MGLLEWWKEHLARKQHATMVAELILLADPAEIEPIIDKVPEDVRKELAGTLIAFRIQSWAPDAPSPSSADTIDAQTATQMLMAGVSLDSVLTAMRPDSRVRTAELQQRTKFSEQELANIKRAREILKARGVRIFGRNVDTAQS